MFYNAKKVIPLFKKTKKKIKGSCMSCKIDLLIPSLNLLADRHGCNFDRCGDGE
jgi:hypothetical protein